MRLIQRVFAVWMALMMLTGSALAVAEPTNPLLGGLKSGHYTKTEDKFVNILLLGIDYGYAYADVISCKTDLNECHTDAVMVVSINKTQKTVDLISLPRDAFSYVPGEKGIYKLNAAVNRAENIEKGIQKTVETVSWHLGGIRIDHYVAVDVPALVALGDAIGGVEFEVDMTYDGEGGRYYKGWQTLNGQGIMDYLRARKNATIGGTDLGRTDRQRRLISAILQKVKANPRLVFKCLGVLSRDDVNIFTDIGFFSAIALAPTALRLDLSNIEKHVLDGSLQDFYSNFNFTDQEARRQMLKDVYGIDAEDNLFVSSRYARWLITEGFEAAKCINVAREVLDATKGGLFASQEHKELWKQLESLYDKALAAFEAAALHQGSDERNAMVRSQNALQKELEASAETLGYTEKLRFKLADNWYEDPMINEHQFNWH